MCNVKILEQRAYKSCLQFFLCLEKCSVSCEIIPWVPDSRVAKLWVDLGRLLPMFAELWVTFVQTCAELWV